MAVFGERLQLYIKGKYQGQQVVNTFQGQVATVTGVPIANVLSNWKVNLLDGGGNTFPYYWLNAFTGHYIVEEVGVRTATEAATMLGSAWDPLGTGLGRRGVVLTPGAQGLACNVTWQSAGLARKRWGSMFLPLTASADYNPDSTLTPGGRATATFAAQAVFYWNTSVTNALATWRFVTGSRQAGQPVGGIDNYIIPTLYSMQRRRTARYAP